jgi:hypothetical protein
MNTSTVAMHQKAGFILSLLPSHQEGANSMATTRGNAVPTAAKNKVRSDSRPGPRCANLVDGIDYGDGVLRYRKGTSEYDINIPDKVKFSLPLECASVFKCSECNFYNYRRGHVKSHHLRIHIRKGKPYLNKRRFPIMEECFKETKRHQHKHAASKECPNDPKDLEVQSDSARPAFSSNRVHLDRDAKRRCRFDDFAAGGDHDATIRPPRKLVARRLFEAFETAEKHTESAKDEKDRELQEAAAAATTTDLTLHDDSRACEPVRGASSWTRMRIASGHVTYTYEDPSAGRPVFLKGGFEYQGEWNQSCAAINACVADRARKHVEALCTAQEASAACEQEEQTLGKACALAIEDDHERHEEAAPPFPHTLWGHFEAGFLAPVPEDDFFSIDFA